MNDPILPEARPLTASTRAEYTRALAAFDRYRAALPQPEPPLAEVVRAFLAALPESKRKNPRASLRGRYPDLPWPTLPRRAPGPRVPDPGPLDPTA